MIIPFMNEYEGTKELVTERKTLSAGGDCDLELFWERHVCDEATKHFGRGMSQQKTDAALTHSVHLHSLGGIIPVLDYPSFSFLFI